MAKSNEALPWSLFSAGGVMAALFIPGLILGLGILAPLMVDEPIELYDQLVWLLAGGWWGWIVKLALVGIIFLTLFHCAHRIRHTATELGLRHLAPLVAVVCYGGAAVGTIVAALLVFTVPGGAG